MQKTLVLQGAAVFSVLGLVGAAVGQEATQPGQSPGADNTGNTMTMTCADLTGMETAESTAFLRG